MTDGLPVATWEGTFTILGVPLRCAVLDNGQRVVNAEDVMRWLGAMDDPGSPQSDPLEVQRFMRWKNGAVGEDV